MNKIKPVFLIPVIIIILMVHCIKAKNEFVLTGKIFDNITKKPIADVRIKLIASHIDSTRTDKEGNYKFIIDRALQDNIELKLIKPQYYTYQAGLILNGGKNKYVQDLGMNPQAYLKIHIKDTGKANPEIYYIGYDDSSPVIYGVPGLDTTVCCITIYGDLDYDYSYYLSYNGSTRIDVIKRIIHVPSFITNNFDIFY